MPIELADEFAAVLVPELERDHTVGKLEDVEGVPAEVVARGGVEIDVAEPGSTTDTVPVVRARRRLVVGAPERRERELRLAGE